MRGPLAHQAQVAPTAEAARPGAQAPLAYGGVVDQAGNGGLVEGPQVIMLASGGDERGVLRHVLWGAVHEDVEFGLDLEVPVEFLVERLKQA